MKYLFLFVIIFLAGCTQINNIYSLLTQPQINSYSLMSGGFGPMEVTYYSINDLPNGWIFGCFNQSNNILTYDDSITLNCRNGINENENENLIYCNSTLIDNNVCFVENKIIDNLGNIISLTRFPFTNVYTSDLVFIQTIYYNSLSLQNYNIVNKNSGKNYYSTYKMLNETQCFEFCYNLSKTNTEYEECYIAITYLDFYYNECKQFTSCNITLSNGNLCEIWK